MVYAQLSKNLLNITGTAMAGVDQDFKVYYTGNVMKEEASETYIKVEASPIAKTKNATVNILGLAKKDDYGCAILEIKNASDNIDEISVYVDANTPTFDGDKELFDINVIMCDADGTQISDYSVPSGGLTYVKVFAKLLKTPTDHQEATITAKIIAAKEEEPGPSHDDKYVCKNQEITMINSFNWDGGSTYFKAIIANKGSTVYESISENLPYWYAFTVITTADGKYTITNIYDNKGTEKGSIPIPENGFIFLVYEPQFTPEDINLNDNELIIKLSDGSTVDSWKTKAGRISLQLGTYDIISGKEIIIDPPDDLNLPKGENDYLYSYYARAERELSKLTLEEKIAQMYVVGGPTSFSNMAQYKFGGYLFFADFFKNKNVSTVSSEIAGYQTDIKNAGGLPLLMSIDEEGNTVSRLKASGFLAANGYSEFKDSCDLYATKEDGSQNWLPIEEDIVNKSDLLGKLGLNLNFAPDVDVADPLVDGEEPYMYKRTLKQNATITGEYASRVLAVSKRTGVSYSLKHFPGYGNSLDTHMGFATDNRTRAEFNARDLIPFKRGIAAGAEFIMVSHNLVTCMDGEFPSSISKKVHDVLRNELGYTNIIITDALNMDAIHDTYTSRDAIIHAINAGNDMICISLNGSGEQDAVAGSDGKKDTLTYAKLISYVVDAVNSGKVTEDTINLAVRRIIAWKMYKGLM